MIVYATGFEASDFLMPMRVTGAGGVDLHEHWAGDARAYLGITVPGFPNLFCLYGPNTNLVANGSIIFFSECAVRYVLSGDRTRCCGAATARSTAAPTSTTRTTPTSTRPTRRWRGAPPT